MAADKGGNNTPKKGEQGFQKSKAGKNAPTSKKDLYHQGVEFTTEQGVRIVKLGFGDWQWLANHSGARWELALTKRGALRQAKKHMDVFNGKVEEFTTDQGVRITRIGFGDWQWLANHSGASWELAFTKRGAMRQAKKHMDRFNKPRIK